MDCVSNALREGAKEALLLDVYPDVPKDGRYPNTPWPIQPRRLLTTYALDEGGERRFARQVTDARGSNGAVETVHARQVTGESSRTLEPVPGSEYTLPAELVLIAIGFTGPEHDGLISDLGVDLDDWGNVDAKKLPDLGGRSLRRGRRPRRRLADRHRDRRGPPLRPGGRGMAARARGRLAYLGPPQILKPYPEITLRDCPTSASTSADSSSASWGSARLRAPPNARKASACLSFIRSHRPSSCLSCGGKPRPRRRPIESTRRFALFTAISPAAR